MRSRHTYRTLVLGAKTRLSARYGFAVRVLLVGWLSIHGAAAQVTVTPDEADDTYYEEYDEEYDYEEGGYEEREPLPAPVVRDFDRDRWTALTEDLRYEEAEVVENADSTAAAAADRRKKERSERSSRYRPRSDRSGSPFNVSEGMGLLLKVLGLVIGLAALVFLLFRVFGDGDSLFRRNRKVNSEAIAIDLENIEENLEHTELETFIQRAVREERYRLAVRLYYLDILKALSARGVVRWKRDKTNGEYLRALHGHPLHDRMAAATRTFERVWYGQADLSAAAFALIEPELQALTRAAGAATPAA